MGSLTERGLYTGGGTSSEVEPAYVKLFDISRGMPQRIEGHYRRHRIFCTRFMEFAVPRAGESRC